MQKTSAPELQLFEHQKLALSYLRTNNQFALFMEQGTGKTIIILFRLLELLKKHRIENALIISPKSAMGSWQRDMEKFQSKDRKLIESSITLVNYDRVWRPKHKAEFDKRWGAIILDESHFIKNRTSKRSEFILKLALKSTYRYILSGTPISNGQLENIWSQFAFLKPVPYRGKVASEIFGSYYDWLKNYARLNQWHQPSSYFNVEQLQHIIQTYSFRVLKQDCLDLPEKLPDDILDVEQKEKKLYQKMARKSAIVDDKMEILAENPMARLSKLRQIVSGFVRDNEGNTINLNTEKVYTLNEFLDGFEKKLVIFADFQHSIDLISEILKKRKIKFVTLDGRQKDKNIWRSFQSDESIRVIICQYQSGATGIDLFAADTTLYFEPTLSATLLDQSRDRTHRNGQHHPCSYIHLITKGTVEEAIYKSVIAYQDFSEKLFTEYMNDYVKNHYR